MESGSIIGLLVAGFLLILFEVFVPGGVLGTIGGLLVVVAIIAGFIHSAAWGLTLLVVSLVAGLLGFYLWLKFFPKSPIGRRIILDNDAGDWHGFDPKQQELVGAEGVSHTPLRPAGIAIVNGNRLDVVTRGECIAANQPVRVIKVEGNRVVVTAIEDSETQSQPAANP
jgi:membrane-bound serine protease (ClpP class)